MQLQNLHGLRESQSYLNGKQFGSVRVVMVFRLLRAGKIDPTYFVLLNRGNVFAIAPYSTFQSRVRSKYGSEANTAIAGLFETWCVPANAVPSLIPSRYWPVPDTCTLEAVYETMRASPLQAGSPQCKNRSLDDEIELLVELTKEARKNATLAKLFKTFAETL